MRFRLFQRSQVEVRVGKLVFRDVAPNMLRVVADALDVARSGRVVTVNNGEITWRIPRKKIGQPAS